MLTACPDLLIDSVFNYYRSLGAAVRLRCEPDATEPDAAPYPENAPSTSGVCY